MLEIRSPYVGGIAECHDYGQQFLGGESTGRLRRQMLTWNFMGEFCQTYLKQLCSAYRFVAVFSVSELTECILWTVLICLNVKLPTQNEICMCDSCVTCPTLMAA